MKPDRRNTFFGQLRGMVQRTVTVFLSRSTPWYVKLILAAGLVYVLSPYDLIPEWIPVFGVMDDLALAAILIFWASGYQRTDDRGQRTE